MIIVLSPSHFSLSDYVNKTALNVFLKALDQPDIMDFTLVSTAVIFFFFFAPHFSICYDL